MSSQKISFAVKGMHCGSCTARVEKALRKMADVVNVTVSLESNSALVEYSKTPDKQALAAAIESITQLGFSVELLA